MGAALADTLELPPHMADDSSKQHGTMVLIFDGAYQRMLTHAMCQYYGLVSTSKTQNDGTRTLSVTVGKAAERLSRTGIVKLSAYLAQRAADAAATPRTCAGAGAGAGALGEFLREGCLDRGALSPRASHTVNCHGASSNSTSFTSYTRTSRNFGLAFLSLVFVVNESPQRTIST